MDRLGQFKAVSFPAVDTREFPKSLKDPHPSSLRGDVSFSSTMSMISNHGSKTTQGKIYAVLHASW